MNSHEAWQQVEDQGTLQPGESGWWKVWGANANHIRPGDLVLAKHGDEVVPTYVAELFPAKAAPMRVGVVTDNDERLTFGVLAPIVLLRQGTHNTLADP